MLDFGVYLTYINSIGKVLIHVHISIRIVLYLSYVVPVTVYDASYTIMT